MDYIILDQLQQAMKRVSGGLITNPNADMAHILDVMAHSYSTLDEVQRRGADGTDKTEKEADNGTTGE
jgi:hypothetical protein